jgi:hypothetical protein
MISSRIYLVDRLANIILIINFRFPIVICTVCSGSRKGSCLWQLLSLVNLELSF